MHAECGLRHCQLLSPVLRLGPMALLEHPRSYSSFNLLTELGDVPNVDDVYKVV